MRCQKRLARCSFSLCHLNQVRFLFTYDTSQPALTPFWLPAHVKDTTTALNGEQCPARWPHRSCSGACRTLPLSITRGVLDSSFWRDSFCVVATDLRSYFRLLEQAGYVEIVK